MLVPELRPFEPETMESVYVHRTTLESRLSLVLEKLVDIEARDR